MKVIDLKGSQKTIYVMVDLFPLQAGSQDADEHQYEDVECDPGNTKE